MNDPVVTAKYDQLPVVATEVGFQILEPDNPMLNHKIRGRFRKMLEFAMPYHVAHHYGFDHVTPETLAAAIESMLDNLTIGEISHIVWESIEDHYEDHDQEMPDA